MKLLVGLGNPGKQYYNTRHNLGFMVTNALLQKYGNENWENSPKHHALLKEIEIDRKSLILMQPHTFMNNSGQAVSSFARFYKIKPEEITLVYDDVALPLGALRIRTGGGSGGHNGVQSVIDSLSTDQFLRIRLGIGAENIDIPMENYVLAPFTEKESEKIRPMINQAIEAIEIICKHGVETYLSKYHTR